MIVIHGAKTTEVDRDWMEIMNLPPMSGLCVSIDNEPAMTAAMDIQTEMIKGQVFRTRSGNDVVIGMDSGLRDILELPFDVYSRMQREVDDLQRRHFYMSRRLVSQIGWLQKYQQMNLLGRIKAVFCGYR